MRSGATEITEMPMSLCRLFELIDTAGRLEAGGGNP